MSNVTILPVITNLPQPPERILEAALENHAERAFSRVIVIGVFEDDGEEYFASSEPDAGTFLWDTERARHALMRIADNG